MDEEFAAFGGLDIDDIPESILRGKYQCELTNARLSDVKKEEYDIKLGRKVWVLDFAVSKNMQYMGESGSIFLNLYTAKGIHQDPETHQLLIGEELIDPKESDNIRKAVRYYRKIAKELGFSQEQIKSGNVNFESLEGQEFMVSLYPDSNNRTRIDQNDSITPVGEAGENSAQLDRLQL